MSIPHLDYAYAPLIRFHFWMQEEEPALATMFADGATPLPRVGDRVRLPVGTDGAMRVFRVLVVDHQYPMGRPAPGAFPEIVVSVEELRGF